MRVLPYARLAWLRYLSEDTAGRQMQYHTDCDCDIVPSWGSSKLKDTIRTSIVKCTRQPRLRPAMTATGVTR